MNNIKVGTDLKDKRLLFIDSNVNLGGSLQGTVGLLNALNQHGFDAQVVDIYGVNERYLELLTKNDLSFKIILRNSSNYVLGAGGIVKRTLKFLHQIPDFIKIITVLRKFLKEESFDYLLVNNKKTLLPVALASIGIKTNIVIYHRVWVKENDIDFFYYILMKLYCKNIISHAKASVHVLEKKFPNINVKYIPNSVELNIAPITKGNDVFTVILPASRPTKLKGYDCAIKAIKEYTNKNGRDIRLLLTGEVPIGHSQDFYQEITKLVNDFELADIVEFVGWRDDILDLINRADLMILPSHTEGFPRVIIESMLLKTPVISTAVGGIPDALEDGVTGYVIDIDDYKSLSERMIDVKEKKVITNEIVERAYSFAKFNFNLEAQTKLFISSLEDK